MESISGVTCKSLDAHTVVVEFPPRPPGQPPASKGGMPGDELILKVTLTFKENSLGYLHLSNVKVSDWSETSVNPVIIMEMTMINSYIYLSIRQKSMPKMFSVFVSFFYLTNLT